METMTQIVESVRAIVCLIVDFPGEVRLTPVIDGKRVVLQLVVAKQDLGKVIGKMGNTARALRLIIQAMSMTQNVPIALDITDNAQQPEPMGAEASTPSLLH